MRTRLSHAIRLALLVAAWGLLGAPAGSAQLQRVTPTDAVRVGDEGGAPATWEAPAQDSLPPRGLWHFGVGFGSVAYGRNSVCACSSFTVDVAVGYEASRGFGAEYQLALTTTTGPLVDQRLNAFYYPRLGRLGRAFGAYAGGGLLREVDGGRGEAWGYAYGYGIRARAPLGGRGRTWVFADVGVSTARERLEFAPGWTGIEVVQRHVHSGLRVRIGVTW